MIYPSCVIELKRLLLGLLTEVWEVLDFRLDVYHITKGGPIELV